MTLLFIVCAKFLNTFMTLLILDLIIFTVLSRCIGGIAQELGEIAAFGRLAFQKVSSVISFISLFNELRLYSISVLNHVNLWTSCLYCFYRFGEIGSLKTASNTLAIIPLCDSLVILRSDSILL